MRSKLFFLFSVVFYSVSTFGQASIRVIDLSLRELPKGIMYEGEIVRAVQWKDKSGDNIVIATETGEFESKSAPDSDYRDAALYGYHFRIVKGAPKQTWKFYDFIKECPVDIEAHFIKNALQVTDLNNNGVGEVWMMYRTACRGDVSSADMKIIMYQGKQKFAARGRTKVRVSDHEFDGGEYTLDRSFREGPKVFREFAKKLWEENILETWK